MKHVPVQNVEEVEAVVDVRDKVAMVAAADNSDAPYKRYSDKKRHG
jgi:hypothetical protein